jgi:hypothetical protein
MMPEFFGAVSARRRAPRTVVMTFNNNSWIHDLTVALTVPVIVQYIHLRQLLDGIVLNPASQNHLLWKWSPSG